MALSPSQQAIERISRAKQILITTNEHPDLDAVAATVALGLLLQKLNKQFDVLVPGWKPDLYPDVLSSQIEVRGQIGAMRAFHLQVNVSQTPLSELMYDVKNGVLDITLIPKNGAWSPQDATFKPGEDRYDLVITVACPDMVSLGTLAREQADFLYRTTIINLDCNPTNEHWGQINLVDLNAVSSTEVIYHWVQEWNASLIDEPIATALLAGMIAKTKSFRTPNVTPKTLAASSQLVTLGAQREKIVHGLWRTRSVTALKLWGRVLSRLEQDRELGLVWAVLAESDFLESGVGPEALEGVVDELIAYTPEAKVTALLLQQPTGIQVNLHANPPFSAAELARPFGGQGTREKSIFIVPRQPVPAFIEETTAIIDRLQKTLRTLRP